MKDLCRATALDECRGTRTPRADDHDYDACLILIEPRCPFDLLSRLLIVLYRIVRWLQEPAVDVALL